MGGEEVHELVRCGEQTIPLKTRITPRLIDELVDFLIVAGILAVGFKRWLNLIKKTFYSILHYITHLTQFYALSHIFLSNFYTILFNHESWNKTSKQADPKQICR